MGRLSTVLLGVSLFTLISSVAAEATGVFGNTPSSGSQVGPHHVFGEGLVHWTRPADDDHI
jgi:hypothetical protein